MLRRRRHIPFYRLSDAPPFDHSRDETPFRHALTGETLFRVGGVSAGRSRAAPPADTPSIRNRVSVLSASRRPHRQPPRRRLRQKARGGVGALVAQTPQL